MTSRAWLLAGVLTTAAMTAVLAAPVTRPRDKQLSPEVDARLRDEISVTARNTTVGRLLAKLTRVTGTQVQSGTADVRDEPIIAYLERRSLGEVLDLLAEEFRWDDRQSYGWFWTRSTDDPPKYALYRDLATRRITTQLRQAERDRFARDLEERVSKFKGRDPRGFDPFEPVVFLPKDVWTRALAGQTLVLSLPQFSDALRATAQRMLGTSALPPQTTISVNTVGEGASLALEVRVSDGQGAVGVSVPPSWTRDVIPYQFAQRIAPDKRKYTGVATLPVKLTAEQARRWRVTRDFPTFLELLARSTDVDVVADDYDYVSLNKTSRRDEAIRGPNRVPDGEPLGFWLDLLCQNASIASTRGRTSSIGWREYKRCIILRNENWWGDDVTRVPAATRSWLRHLQQSDPGHVLEVSEVRRLLSETNDQHLHSLARQGLLPAEDRLHILRPYLSLAAVLDVGRFRQLFSSTGLSISALTPSQRAVACTRGPGLFPVATEWVLKNQLGGDLWMSLVSEDGKLIVRQRSPARKDAPVAVDLRLGEADSEVCLVTRGADPG